MDRNANRLLMPEQGRAIRQNNGITCVLSVYVCMRRLQMAKQKANIGAILAACKV